MATINFILRNRVKSTSTPIHIRFIHTREIDIHLRTNILVNSQHWDSKKQIIKNIITIKNRDEINLKLNELKIHIINEFNSDYIAGEIINKEWLSKVVNTFFNRPISEVAFKIKEEEVYFSAFASWWLEVKAPLHKVSASKYMGSKTIQHHSRLRDMFIEFEGKKRIKMKDLTNEIIDQFSIFLSEKKYAKETVTRHINRLKFFCERAFELNIEINKGYKQRIFVQDEEIKYKAPYLNIEEINRIYNLKITDEVTDAVRDNFIIGLWTGLRVSDFLNRLSIDNISNGYITIKTMKTGHTVSIPVHWQVQEILNKRNGQLPPKTTDQHFNRTIKNICQDAKINNEIIGGKIISNKINGENIKRKEVDKYPKYELVSSHICRRSFATNHFGKVPNKVIMDVCGWKSEKQMLDYNKQTNIESAMILAEYWEKEMIKLEKEAL